MSGQKKHKLTWDIEPDIYSAIAENEMCSLVRPETYHIHDNNRSLLAATHALQTPLDRVVVIHHEERLELGNIRLVFGGQARHNYALAGIKELLGTEMFPRLEIGVGHPIQKAIQGRYLPTWTIGEHNYREWFLYNKFPEQEMEMMEHIMMPKIFEAMDYAMNCKKEGEFLYDTRISYKELKEMNDERKGIIKKELFQ